MPAHFEAITGGVCCACPRSYLLGGGVMPLCLAFVRWRALKVVPPPARVWLPLGKVSRPRWGRLHGARPKGRALPTRLKALSGFAL